MGGIIQIEGDEKYSIFAYVFEPALVSRQEILRRGKGWSFRNLLGLCKAIATKVERKC